MKISALSLIVLATQAGFAFAQSSNTVQQDYQPINGGGQPVIFQPVPAPAPAQQNEAVRQPPEQRGYLENPNTTWQNNLVKEFPPIVGTSIIDDPSRTLTQGTIIEAVFGGAVSSELPGSVIASVRRAVYSMDGTRLLIPRGSKLYGEYRADTKLAQTRLMIVWSRVITPDGLSAQIASGATDAQGRAGATGIVDTHFDERFGAAALLSLIGVAPVALVSNDSDSNSVRSDLAAQVGSDLQDSTATALEDYLNITPTIYVDQGERINAILQRDVVFENL